MIKNKKLLKNLVEALHMQLLIMPVVLHQIEKVLMFLADKRIYLQDIKAYQESHRRLKIKLHPTEMLLVPIKIQSSHKDH